MTTERCSWFAGHRKALVNGPTITYGQPDPNGLFYERLGTRLPASTVALGNNLWRPVRLFS
jgi:hypothetical protein